MSTESLKLYPVAERALNSTSLLTVSALIEHFGTKVDNSDSKITYAKDVVFLSIRGGVKSSENNKKHLTYSKEKEAKIAINGIKLRALSYAMKELYMRQEESFKSDFKLETATGIAYLDIGDKGFFLNIKIKNGENVSVLFDKFIFISFADSLINIADELETALFRHQREIKKTNNSLMSKGA